MSKKHEDFLKMVFANKGVCHAGTDLTKMICEKFEDCSDVNARKIIQMAATKKIIKSSKPVTFGKNQYAYCNNNDEFTFSLVENILKNYRPPLYRMLCIFDLNGGILSYGEAFKIAGCPVQKGNTKVNSLNELIYILEKLNIVERANDQGINYIIRKDCLNESISLMKEHVIKMKIDCTFIPIMLMWLQKHNIIDNSNVIYRSKHNPSQGAIHNNLTWDAFAYTKATGFYDLPSDVSEDKRTLVVLDFCISRVYTIHDLNGFYDRVQIDRNSVQKSKRKVLPIVVANDIDNEAQKSIKKLGFLCFNLGTVFGEKIYEIIEKLKIISLQDLYGNDYSTHKDTVQRIEDILSTLRSTGQEINFENMKGDLFESLMYKVFSIIYPSSNLSHSFTINKTDENGKRIGYEYDYIIQTKDEIIIVELKGYKWNACIKLGKFDEIKKLPDKNTIKWFFSNTYPFAKKHFKDDPFKRNIKASYITTANFELSAIDKLESLNKGTDKPNDIELFYNGEDLLELLKKYNLKKEGNIIKRYYMYNYSDVSKDNRKDCLVDNENIYKIKETEESDPPF